MDVKIATYMVYKTPRHIRVKYIKLVCVSITLFISIKAGKKKIYLANNLMLLFSLISQYMLLVPTLFAIYVFADNFCLSTPPC